MKLPEVEGAIRRAVQRHEAHLLAVSHMDHVFAADPDKPHPTVAVFTLCQPQLYAALLAVDVRFSAFLPCRVSAAVVEDGVELYAIAPREFCHLLNRPDLERLLAPLETLLREVMDEASRPQATLSHAAHSALHYSFGATEENMSMQATVPQRIDCKGTKIEELAGVGGHDSGGG
ncbi:MAG: DUF302 domain-containing protein [Acidobacteria bacterium]|nr:DUF302 domain-containing protein [Acidobacteriota bacterium]